MRTRNVSLLLVQFSSVWDPMDCNMPRQLPEFTQTHVHRVSDAIQPSHPLSSPQPKFPNEAVAIYTPRSKCKRIPVALSQLFASDIFAVFFSV